MQKIVFVGILVLIVLVGGFFVLRQEAPSNGTQEETSSNALATYTNEAYGFTFVYPGGDAYVLEDDLTDLSDDPRYVHGLMLTEKGEYDSLQNATEPREGPPTIQVRIYRNPERLWPAMWADRNGMESNIGLATEEPKEATIGEAKALRFTADGLYPIDTFVVTSGEYVYFLTGAYLDFDSKIHHDYLGLVESFSFMPTDAQQSGRVPTFDAYPIDVAGSATITPSEPDFATNPDAEAYSSAITEGAALGPNFAGHYTVVTWGCGEGCEVSAILDALDGRIVAYGILSSYGLSYELDSALLIVNPKEDLPEESLLNAEADASSHFPIGAVPVRSDHYALENGEFYFIGTFNVATGESPVCAQVISLARNPVTLEEREFGSPCVIPFGWEALETAEGDGSVTFTGEVTDVDLEEMAVDGPARITFLTADDETYTITVPSMGLPLCAARDTIASVSDINIGDQISVSGTQSSEGDITPCESAEHYLRILE